MDEIMIATASSGPGQNSGSSTMLCAATPAKTAHCQRER